MTKTGSRMYTKRSYSLDQLGCAGALCTTALGMGCCAPGPLAALTSLVGSVGLGVLLRLDILMPILYAALAITLAGLTLAYRSHRTPYPLALGVIGAALVLYPFHTVLELAVFFVLIFTGWGSLLAASLWGTIVLTGPGRFTCRLFPSPSRGTDMAVQEENP